MFKGKYNAVLISYLSAEDKEEFNEIIRKKIRMRVLVLGSTGLLGQALMAGFKNSQYEGFGTIRSSEFTDFFPKNLIDI